MHGKEVTDLLDALQRLAKHLTQTGGVIDVPIVKRLAAF